MVVYSSSGSQLFCLLDHDTALAVAVLPAWLRVSAQGVSKVCSLFPDQRPTEKSARLLPTPHADSQPIPRLLLAAPNKRSRTLLMISRPHPLAGRLLPT